MPNSFRGGRVIFVGSRGLSLKVHESIIGIRQKEHTDITMLHYYSSMKSGSKASGKWQTPTESARLAC